MSRNLDLSMGLANLISVINILIFWAKKSASLSAKSVSLFQKRLYQCISLPIIRQQATLQHKPSFLISSEIICPFIEPTFTMIRRRQHFRLRHFLQLHSSTPPLFQGRCWWGLLTKKYFDSISIRLFSTFKFGMLHAVAFCLRVIRLYQSCKSVTFVNRRIPGESKK